MSDKNTNTLNSIKLDSTTYVNLDNRMHGVLTSIKLDNINFVTDLKVKRIDKKDSKVTVYFYTVGFNINTIEFFSENKDIAQSHFDNLSAKFVNRNKPEDTNGIVDRF